MHLRESGVERVWGNAADFVESARHFTREKRPVFFLIALVLLGRMMQLHRLIQSTKRFGNETKSEMSHQT